MSTPTCTPRKGITLVELVTWIVIIGVIAAVLIPIISPQPTIKERLSVLYQNKQNIFNDSHPVGNAGNLRDFYGNNTTGGYTPSLWDRFMEGRIPGGVILAACLFIGWFFNSKPWQRKP